jgi:Tfp pilus assembly protein PilX
MSNDKGYAMVIALSFITVLALLAVIIVSVATSEKRTAFNEGTTARAFYSADAGGEASINWLRIQNSPPGLLDGAKHVYVAGGYQTLTSYDRYNNDVTYIRKRMRPGWDITFKDFEYTIDSNGSSVAQSQAEVEVQALRLFKEGY